MGQRACRHTERARGGHQLEKVMPNEIASVHIRLHENQLIEPEGSQSHAAEQRHELAATSSLNHS
jgi:hypothetical protein